MPIGRICEVLVQFGDFQERGSPKQPQFPAIPEAKALGHALLASKISFARLRVSSSDRI